MTGVKLDKIGSHIRYNVSCCDFKDPVCHTTTKLTLWNDYGHGNAVFLDRHLMDCGGFGFISSFQLESISSLIRYAYKCCAIFDSKWKNLTQCFDRFTSYVADNAHSIYTLAQIPVQCETGFGLSSIEMQRLVTGHWRFGFRC